MAHPVYVLTPDPEGFCNPYDWLEAHSSWLDAEQRALAIVREQVETEDVGDPQFTNPPLQPGASERCWAVTRPTDKEHIRETTVYLGDDDPAETMGYRSFLIFRLDCPGGS